MRLFLNPTKNNLFSSGNKWFSPKDRSWQDCALDSQLGREISTEDAVHWLQTHSGFPCRTPVAIIGGREASSEQLSIAEEMGSRLAKMGLTLICGGRQGIMEAASRGTQRSGGISVGILPDADPVMANAHVTIPIATGIGIARNALLACAGLCLIAIGGGYGTISEIAFGLQFKKPVFVLEGGPEIKGVHICLDVNQAVEGVARTVLGLPSSNDSGVDYCHQDK